MASLKQNIEQAIADFNSVQSAIEYGGVAVPYGTDTSEYGTLVRQAIDNASATASGVFNAETHYDFPSVGDVDVIYKAQSERLIYQWNPTALKYEVLCDIAENLDIDLIHGGDADGID